LTQLRFIAVPHLTKLKKITQTNLESTAEWGLAMKEFEQREAQLFSVTFTQEAHYLNSCS